MGKRSSLQEVFVHTKTLMGNEFGEVCNIFGKNQLPPRILEKSGKKQKSYISAAPPRVFEKFVGRFDENRGNRPDAT